VIWPAHRLWKAGSIAPSRDRSFCWSPSWT